MDKRQKDHSNEFVQKEAQEEGNQLLLTEFIKIRKAFPELNFNIRSEEDQNDKGIDFQFELIDKIRGKTFDLIKIQNKGTYEVLKPLVTTENKGLISFQLSVKHARYYRQQIPLALIFTICDISSQKVYWHPIQLDDSIDLRAQEAELRETESIQIYIDPKKSLTPETFRSLLLDVENSYQEQNSRFLEFRKNPILDLEAELKFESSKTLLDQLYDHVVQLYKELRFVPIHILTRNYPFRKAQSFISYYSNFSVITDNEELFEFLESVEATENGKVEYKNLEFIKGVENHEEKTKTILKKLTENQIYSVTLSKGRKSAQIKFKYDYSCLCIACQFSRINIKRLFQELVNEPDDLQECMQHAYTHYQLGNYVQAATLFQKIAGKAKKQERYIIYYITQFNLLKLGRFIINNCWDEEHQKLGKKLSEINLDRISHLSGEKRNKALFSWIKEQRFFYEFQYEINTISSKIRDDYQAHLNGGWSSNDSIHDLISSYGQLHSFVNGNYIIYDQFSEYTALTDAFTEGLFASYAMKKADDRNIKKFNAWMIEMLFFHGNHTTIKRYYNNYLLKPVYFERNKNGYSFFRLIENLLLNNQDIKRIAKKHIADETYQFRNKYQSIFCNALCLASILQLSDEEANRIGRWLITCLSNSELYTHECYQQLKYYFHRRSKQLSAEILAKMLYLTLEKTYLQDVELLEILAAALSKRTQQLDLDVVKQKSLLKISFKSSSERNFEFGVYFYSLATDSFKRKIKGLIVKTLEQNFSPHKYYIAAIFDILPINSAFFNLFISSSLPKKDALNIRSSFFGREDNRYPLLDMLINLCFKNDVKLTEISNLNFIGVSDYYDWLLDMEGFNYQKFDVKWLALYTTKYYFNEFRKYDIIKTKLSGYLLSARDPQLERVYVDLYSTR